MNQTLAQHCDNYDEIIGVRSRRSGREGFVDVELGFADDATIADIARRSQAIADDLRRRLSDIHVRVLPVVSGGTRASAESSYEPAAVVPEPVARSADWESGGQLQVVSQRRGAWELEKTPSI